MKVARGMPLREFAASLVIVGVLGILLLPACRRIDVSPRASCQNHLKQWGLIFKMYAQESRGAHYPPMQIFIEPPQISAAAAPHLGMLYPEYLSDAFILVCPSDSKADFSRLLDASGNFNGHIPDFAGGSASEASMSYVYWGYFFDKTGDDDPTTEIGDAFEALFGMSSTAAGPAQMVEGVKFLGDQLLTRPDVSILDEALLVETQSLGSGLTENHGVVRLSEDIHRHLGMDFVDRGAAPAMSEIWVMHDKRFGDNLAPHADPLGANVLFMDGHVEFIEYPGKGPISRSMHSLIDAVL